MSLDDTPLPDADLDAPADSKTDTTPATRRPADVYSDAVNAARRLYQSLLAADNQDGAPAVPTEILEQITALAVAGDPDLIALVDRCSSDHHVYTHVVNVTILALRLGVQLQMTPDELRQLGPAAFLHDVGMAAYLELAQKPTPLTEEERTALNTHTTEGLQRLEQFSNLDGSTRNAVQTVVKQVHERRRGGGYPSGLEGDEIHPFARLVSLCDAYEAMTHPRPFRPRVIPHEAMRRLVEEHEDDFEPAHVGALLDVLSLYPPASFVRLNTGDIARVMGVNTGLPTRPRVIILIDTDGKRVPGRRVVNLSTRPGLYISDAIDETTLKTSDTRLAMELRAQRWWVKGL